MARDRWDDRRAPVLSHLRRSRNSASGLARVCSASCRSRQVSERRVAAPSASRGHNVDNDERHRRHDALPRGSTRASHREDRPRRRKSECRKVRRVGATTSRPRWRTGFAPRIACSLLPLSYGYSASRVIMLWYYPGTIPLSLTGNAPKHRSNEPEFRACAGPARERPSRRFSAGLQRQPGDPNARAIAGRRDRRGQRHFHPRARLQPR